MSRRGVGITRVPTTEDPPDHVVPDRMRYLERWDLPGTELYVDDEIGDGQLISTGRGFPVLAFLSHAGGVLNDVVWQGPAGAWTATERVQIKAKLAEVLANRAQFRLGGMRFRPHVAADPLKGQPVVYVYRTDVYPEVLVAVSGSGGLALTPGHRYLDVTTLDRAVNECLSRRSAS